MSRRLKKRLFRRLKAVLGGCGLGMTLGSLTFILMALGGAPDIHPSVCTGHAAVFTTFSADIHC